MGLDMRPMAKPKPGFEDRFNQIFGIIQRGEEQKITFWDRFKGKRAFTKDELLKEFFENSIPTYETIKAPKVGREDEANQWVRQEYLKTDKSISENEFVKKYEGYYVIELAKERDGVPVYISFGQDENVFRGQFLKNCFDLIGEELVAEAWNTKLSSETLSYGEDLMRVADGIAEKNNLEFLKIQHKPPDSDMDSLENKLHIIYSLAKWLIFYGKNGHGYEADF